MFRKLFTLLFAFSAFLSAYGQQPDGSHLRISLITCGPGNEEVWEVFGHTAVRVIDSVAHTDLAFNYGTFEYGPDFEIKFMRGKLLYSLSVAPFDRFMQEYIEAKRSVQEQELILSDPQKEVIYSYLDWNAMPEHRYYKYDFFFDNCATRIRDIFPKTLGHGFRFGPTYRKELKLTYRDIINKYFYSRHWERVGVNILLGSKIDRVMSNEDIMFLPDYLRDGVAGAALNDNKIAEAPALLLPGGDMPPAGMNWAFVLTICLATLTIAGLTIKGLQWLGRMMSSLLLFVTGLLGCIILVMWLATDHQTCQDNFNLLWALPTNIVIAFFRPKGRTKYALIAIVLIFISLLLHLLKIQRITLLEIGPLMLSMLFIFGTIYKQGRVKSTHYA